MLIIKPSWEPIYPRERERESPNAGVYDACIVRLFVLLDLDWLARGRGGACRIANVTTKIIKRNNVKRDRKSGGPKFPRLFLSGLACQARCSGRLVLPPQPISIAFSFSRRLGTWYMAPQGLSHSVSIPRATAHAVPSRERGLSNRRSGEARCRQLSAVREGKGGGKSKKTGGGKRGQEMKEEEIPKSLPPCLKRFDFGLTTTELKVVHRYPRRPSCTKDPCAATDAGFGAVERTKRNKNREIRRKRRAHQTCNSDAPVVNYLAGGEQDRGEADDDVDKA
ncbi:hypothetical protein ALC60_12599 [Trachymyrmex zeteki]|uniref:Uncharacterized protein n=1 Tax=Mycetomoellerius zeteki TaxID=64791 RepID=A0A151WKC1_9HYME|nr:hypothetical protein ALC60_12599 [Trachymyrmex zeteki]